ncbi:MAG: 4Fe-4S dicluster domain-containing protein [Armatimonadetes bacterium]|nr:4Fe-4S dicluster domain-containing protein [Armatimonadota bacterium]MBS1710420.1 4Fe-4S dicluster domain-containing protein [Armatimonadota bacterium]MBX3108091.1 4Fe-4S dicluster domain-containing protein [Fimbriimonadaceae bacterium]
MGKSNDQGKGAPIRLYKGLDHYEAPETVAPWEADEFPDRESLKGLPRRDVLKLMGGAAMLAGLAGCRYQPIRKIVPFAQQPEGAVAGLHKRYATAAVKDGFAVSLLAEQVDGRPVRLDGNPLHATTLGSIDSRLCAEILNLYDPDRMKTPSFRGVPTGWNEVFTKIEEAVAVSAKGAGIRILSETVTSPTLARLASDLQTKLPGLKWHQYEPVNRDAETQASQMAFGQDLVPHYDFTRADVLVSIDCDLLHSGPMSIRYSRDVASRRNPDGDMSRIYAFESQPTTLGVSSDHRARVKPSEALGLVLAIAQGLGLPGASANPPSSVDKAMLDAAVADLRAAGRRAVLVAGSHLPAQVHAAVMAVNTMIGSEAATFRKNPQPVPSSQMADLADLVAAMNSNQVDTLIILGGNPAYTAPKDLGFKEALSKVKLKACLATHVNETAKLCDYALPETHFLESWGDGVAFDGTHCVVQPLIEPLYDGKSPIQVVGKFIGDTADPQALVKATAEAEKGGDWNAILATGFYEPASTGGAGPVNPTVTNGILGSLPSIQSGGTELLILPDPMIGDGRNANNMWLQETPNPVTNLVWDNALLISQKTADQLGVTAPYDKKTPVIGTPFYGKADMVEVTANGQTLEVPVWVNMGQADDVAILHMGYGRTEAGDFGTTRGESGGGGFDANSLRSSANPVWVSGVQIKKTGREYALANTQHHNTIDYRQEDRDRHIWKGASLAQYKSGKPFGEHEEGHHGEERDYNEFGKGEETSLYPGLDFKDDAKNNYQWAMTIDLSLCTGCQACVTACQAENNIPTVGKQQVMRGREMHWMRIDRYYKGTGKDLDKDNPPIVVQPVTCMHCEQAPCEPVCPVGATVHSHEGLNQMVYNRCVGTRYCSNNCPYKVRRFNFFHFSQRADNVPVLKMLQNPDVTVRYRGVMEKCTYCVQRINKARITAKKEGRAVADGEIKTACQVACPSQAIIFGDMRNPKNEVAMSRASKRNYLMLEELNTRPRTTYLSRVTNPNPALEEAH